MTVKEANEMISEISQICRDLLSIRDSSETKLSQNEMDVLCDATVILRDYARVIKNAINNAEVNI